MNGSFTEKNYENAVIGEGVRARLAAEYESAFREFGLVESL